MILSIPHHRAEQEISHWSTLTKQVKKVKIYHTNLYRGVVSLKIAKHNKQVLDEIEQMILFYQWRAEDVPQIIVLRDTDK